MNSAGDDAEQLLRVVNVHMDALSTSFEEALAAVVPTETQDEVRARWEEQVAQPIRRARVLSGSGGPRPWSSEWDPSSGYYWRRLRAYLLDHLERSPSEVESVDDSSDKVLSHLEDPRPTGPNEFRVRGLVIGYVQSGKTANFSALIAKAADLGYKLVIVLSGLHNGLRQQTQRRLEAELGLSDVGVGLPEHGRRWITLTRSDLHGDFRPGTSDPNVLQGNELVLLVVKKNASVLRRLVAWMDGRAPDDLPVLIVDDEADQASINTGGNRPPAEDMVDLAEDDVDGRSAEAELDPSAINALIRDLLASFRRVSYVGYTATPFANVLINHEAVDREVLDDLYPRDFIVSLPRPNGYVGSERLFGREGVPGEPEGGVEGLDVIELIPDVDVSSLVPPPREAETFEPQLPASLATALIDFVLATAGRAQRGAESKPSSMLIHTHFRTAMQNRLADEVKAQVTAMRQEWRYDRDALKPRLEARWEEDFRPVVASQDLTRDIPFGAIEEHVDRLFRDGIAVLVLNSTTVDVLDYEADPSLKAVLVGGNRLSRGLTLEGLVVSYYVRPTPYFDTLLQMGRWFGFREDYVDLTRLWTTHLLASWFRDLALREEELRQEIQVYERERLTPLQFGPKMRAHPAMMITAVNKMGAARLVLQSYAGRLLQTSRFRLSDREWLEHNLEATRSFLAGLGGPTTAGDRGPIWINVGWEQVDRFLADYRTSQERSSIDAGTISRYIREQVSRGELVRWRVAVLGQRSETELGVEDLGVTDFGAVYLIARSRLREDQDSIGVLITSPARSDGSIGEADEEIGLSEEQILAARATYQEDEFATVGDALRAQRDPAEGLLLMYPISKHSQPRPGTKRRLPLFDDPEVGSTVVGVAFVFPASDSAATVEYVAGSVGAEDESADG